MLITLQPWSASHCTPSMTWLVSPLTEPSGCVPSTRASYSFAFGATPWIPDPLTAPSMIPETCVACVSVAATPRLKTSTLFEPSKTL